MTILITGGAGFIGANFLWYCAERYPQDTIVCVDNLTYAADYSNIEKLVRGGRVAFVRADISDGSAMRKVFTDFCPEIVVNFAAESHVDRSIADSSIFLKTNVSGVQVLLDECVRTGCRFHQISTDEVYGDLPLNGGAFTEDSPLKPSSPYAASKAAADVLSLSYVRTHGAKVTITRCSNNYGKFQHEEKLIPHTILRALRDQPVPVYGTGENVRDWISVADHCRAVDAVIRRGKIGEIYHVGACCEIDNLSLVRKILLILNRSESLISLLPDRKGHDLRYALNASKIRKELGWTPRDDFASGLKSTVEWYCARWVESEERNGKF